MRIARALCLLSPLLFGAASARADALDEALAAHCAPDPRLSRVAAGALLDPTGFEPRSLRTLAWGAGLRGPTVHALVLRGGDPDATAEAVSAWLARQDARVGLSRCARSSYGGLTAVALVPRVVDVSGDVARGWTVAAAPPGVGALTLLATSGGEVRRAPMELGAPVFLPLEPGRAWTLQVMGELSTGPAPVALWEETSAAPLPGHSGPDLSGQDPSGQELWGARNLVGAINELRVTTGGAPLRRDPLLELAATRHAWHLASLGRVEHTPERDDSPLDRLRVLGVSTARVAENIARARTISEAHTRLAASPAHRANLLDAEVDCVGVGVARSSGNVYVVELFATHPALISGRGE